MKELKHRLQTTTDLSIEKQIVINMFLTHNKLKNDLLNELKPYDLSLEQFNVLRILRGQKGNPINLQDIQERMINKMSNTTRLVDKLILKGFVKRNQCKSNRRKIEIYITSEGLKILNKLDSTIDKTEQTITSNLSQTELKKLNELLLKLKQNKQ
ncbi:MarR family winged helix-turn-helix transcriptional regulator [Psychroserpens ponticola]|uniref:MarR family transcriptional regulator n=1 Tax=Psychroserpens ponticola TaxID=2932268 RepID=A0ABY7RUV9_9FLAO|nr:MarR family transcriptional regulator [Psychroserpens ponticola]WCO00910.1 MarR family transcriptional regulator [Psychroserpens ponticola]